MIIWQWQDKSPVVVTFPNGAEVRLTVVSASGYELGVYQALMREARDYIKLVYHVEAVKFLENASPDALAEWGRYHQRAILFGVLSTVETRENADAAWTVDHLPDEWKAITTFDRAIPGALYDEWLQTALDLNPGQFLELPGDSEKKFVRVSSSRLLN